MLYITGTIDRKDGKRMTRKRADAVFDEFLGWLENTQGCLFGGSFNPSYGDGDAGTMTVAAPTVTAKEAGWHFPKKKPKTKKRKAPKRKAKR